MKARVGAAFLWSIVALQVVLISLGIVLEALARSASSPLGASFAIEVVGNAISTLTFPAVGALIFWRRPEHPIGWLFCAANAGWAINNFAGSYARYALIANPGSLPAAEAVAWFYTWPGPISVGLYILLVLLFPDGTPLSPRWRPVVWLVVAWSVVAAAVMAFAPGPIDETIEFEISNPLGIEGLFGHVLAPLAESVVLPSALLLFVAGAISVIVRFRRSRRVERQQLKWFVSSVAFVSFLFAVMVALYSHYGATSTALPGWAELFVVLGIFSPSLIPAAAGIAILRYRLYDIDILINRTLVYGALTATLAGIYFGGVVLMQYLFRFLTGQESQLAVVASTLAIAAMFNPLRRRIQSFIDRRFYRRKYDTRKTLEAFSARLRDETDLDALNDELVKVVRETMQPAHVSLWLRSDPDLKGEQAD